MIAILAATAMQSSLTVVKLPDLESANVTALALVRLPKLSDAERLCVKVAWRSILEGSEEYGEHTLRGYLQLAGKPIVAEALRDHLVLRVTFPKEQLSTAVSMMDSLLRRPLLEAPALNESIEALKSPKKDVWAAALEPEVWREARPSLDEVRSVYRGLVRPENVILAFGGAFEEAALAQALRRFEDWNPKPAPGQVRSWAVAKAPLLKSPTKVGTVELSGPEFSATDPAFPVQVLAATALGVGSGSAIFRVAREANGWSYVQEGFLDPTPAGLRLRLIFAHAGEPEVLATIDPFRAGLLEEVKKWTQADRSRALSLAKNWIENGIGASPIWLMPEGNRVESPEERLHLHAWWRMKFGANLDPARFAGVLEQVTLDDLKSAATTAVEQASARMLVPTP